MPSIHRHSLALLMTTTLLACAPTADVRTPPEAAPEPAAPTAPPPTAADNPLLAEWTGPYGGLPPFDQVRVEHFQPALEAAMGENLAEIEQIAADPAAPTFDNTIAAMERAGGTLDRVRTLYSTWSSTMAGPEFQAVEREMAPRLAAFSDQISQNAPLFQRIEAVYNSPEMETLTPEQQRLTWLYYTNFVRTGARLDEAGKARLSEINQRLATLFTEFGQNVLADEGGQHVVLESEEDLAGLPQSFRDAAAAAAEDREMPGKWVVRNTRSAVEPFLTYADRRDLREQVFRMFVTRGDMGGEHDNNAIIEEVLRLRLERARLLGHETHAHWRLENTMAGTPDRAMELMEAVWPAAVDRVHEEVADMQALADAEGAGITIEPWDYRYYAEKVRAQRYDLDEEEVKQYLQLERLIDGMFWVGGEVFGLDFAPLSGIPVYHPDVQVWEATRRGTGEHVGLFYLDPYARDGKRSGAWMSSYRRQHRLDASEVSPIVSNNSNFVKARPGEPILISWIDAETLFHEFGHALHGLLSDVTYPSVSGTAVARDYVEFPSQVLEHWLATPEVLDRFAVHHETGESMPQELVERIERAATFNEGFRTVEYLSGALYDMRIHLVTDREIDPPAFEREIMDEYGMPREIVLRHRPTHFLHVYASDGYSAGYYSYLWSDVLTADTWEAFLEGEGPYDREVARRLVDHIFSVGNTVDPADGYRAFRGRDPVIEPLMRKRGFLD
jgi:peptidyl-dipeptidase Dcp